MGASIAMQHNGAERLSSVERLFMTYFTRRPAELAISAEIQFRMEFLGIDSHKLASMARIGEKEMNYIRVGLFFIGDTNPGHLERIAELLRTDAKELFRIGGRAETTGKISEPASRRSFGFLVETLCRDMENSPENYRKAVMIGIAARLRRERIPKMTRHRFSLATGVSENYITLLEHGNVPERFLDSRVDAIAKSLGTDAEVLHEEGSRLLELIISRNGQLSLSKLADRLKSYAFERSRWFSVKSAKRK